MNIGNLEIRSESVATINTQTASISAVVTKDDGTDVDFTGDNRILMPGALSLLPIDVQLTLYDRWSSDILKARAGIPI